MREDILARLDRILDATPEHAYAAPPLPRQMIAQAAAEIRTLRARLAQLRARTSEQAESQAE